MLSPPEPLDEIQPNLVCDLLKYMGRAPPPWALWRGQISFNLNNWGIWKVRSMVIYLSNRFTNPIMFCIISKNHIFSMLCHILHEVIIIQTRKYYCKYMYCLYTGKRKISVENITFYALKSVQNINNSL